MKAAASKILQWAILQTLLLCCFLPASGLAQIDCELPDIENVVGGGTLPSNVAWMQENLDYNLAIRSQDIKGQVIVYVEADASGNHLQHWVIKEAHPLLTKRVVSLTYSLQFPPSIQPNDSAVQWSYLKVDFSLPDNAIVSLWEDGYLRMPGPPTVYPKFDDYLEVDQLPEAANLNDVWQKMEYPTMAKELEIEGKVIVACLIDRQGNLIEHVVCKTPHPILTNAVIKLLPKIKFTPAMKAGKPLAYWLHIPFVFDLDH